MNAKGRIVRTLIAAFTLFILILDTKTAVLGAKEGIIQCITAIIPSLFPFFIACGLFCQCMQQHNLAFLTPLCRVCKIPKGSEPFLLIGFLGGYPVGAREITVAYKDGKLNRFNAERMLPFCNNAGPSFIFGILALQFSNKTVGIWLFIIQILSAILTAIILPGKQAENVSIAPNKQDYISVFNGSLHAIISVCGWVVIFRIILSFLQRWILWALPEYISVIISGILELATGCTQLNIIENDGLRMVLSSAMLSLGGICVYLQTRSVTASLRLNIYFPGKIIQCCIAIILSGLMQIFLFTPTQRIPVSYLLFPLCCIILVNIVSFKPIFKKRVAIGV